MSTDRRFYVTTAIPYVNGDPHLGHALELVQVDALARWHRRRGRSVRSLTGTDDNAAKNVSAAQAAGVDVVVTDHHRPRDDGALPDGVLVHPAV